jgi:hypothetical protein
MKIVLAVLAALLVTAGCARADDTSSPPAAAPPPSSSAAPSSAAPSDDLSPSVKPPQGRPGVQTLTGTVTDGVEPGCVLLSGPAGSHLLIFDDPALKAQATSGTELAVTGQVKPDMMSTCQQGTPFLVTGIRPA